MAPAVTFHDLYQAALARYAPRRLTPFIEAGGVSAALLTDRGNVYTGVCIDTASGLGMCAERNAIANMITCGESRVVKLVAYVEGRVGSPCGACREYLMQLDEGNRELEVLLDLATLRTVRLGELIPDWWGDRYYQAARQQQK